MSDLDVQLVELEPMHVVAAVGYGADPEYQAWGLILDFARDQQLDPWDSTHRFFGFNNPDPESGSGEYGYEQWMTISRDLQPATPLEVKDVPGGRYAKLAIHGLDTIGDSWQYLADWCRSEGHELDSSRDPCLEELLTPVDRNTADWDLNLYLAIV